MRRGVWLLALALPGWAGDEVRWNSTLTPHFAVSHQAPLPPQGLTMSIERMHGRLRMDLAMFSPWMARERLKLFIYKDKSSYLAGRFRPPPWSNGVALYDEKTVAVYEQRSQRRLLEVIAHETTHLLFESFWGEAGKTPPSWLNEGLAMLSESETADRPERSGWYRAMTELPARGFLPFHEFFSITPTRDIHQDDDRAVETWYVQSYSVVYFLLRRHSRLQFKSFCAQLREGKSVSDALWSVYRYRGASALQAAWLAWLKDPAHAERVSASFERRPDEREAKTIGEIKGFRPLRAPRGEPGE